jgi:hypothetical protein
MTRFAPAGKRAAMFAALSVLFLTSSPARSQSLTPPQVFLPVGPVLLVGETWHGLVKGLDDGSELNLSLNFSDDGTTIQEQQWTGSITPVPYAFSFTFDHVCTKAGTWILKALVVDLDGQGQGVSGSFTVLGKLSRGLANQLKAPLNQAITRLNAGKNAQARTSLTSFLTLCETYMRLGVLSQDDGLMLSGRITFISGLIKL